jgi:cytoskeletal protein RodZ
LSVSDVADTTKISIAAIRAMERNDFGRLPGGVFSRAYLRAFADQVGLDGEELVREYCARSETVSPPVTALPEGTEPGMRRRAIAAIGREGLLAAIRRLLGF